MMFEELGARLDDWLHSVKLRRIRLMRWLGLLPKPTPEQIRAAEASDYSVRVPRDPSIKRVGYRITFRAEGADLKCTVSDGEPLESVETLNWRWPAEIKATDSVEDAG